MGADSAPVLTDGTTRFRGRRPIARIQNPSRDHRTDRFVLSLARCSISDSGRVRTFKLALHPPSKEFLQQHSMLLRSRQILAATVGHPNGTSSAKALVSVYPLPSWAISTETVSRISLDTKAESLCFNPEDHPSQIHPGRRPQSTPSRLVTLTEIRKTTCSVISPVKDGWSSGRPAIVSRRRCGTMPPKPDPESAISMVMAKTTFLDMTQDTDGLCFCRMDRGSLHRSGSARQNTMSRLGTSMVTVRMIYLATNPAMVGPFSHRQDRVSRRLYGTMPPRPTGGLASSMVTAWMISFDMTPDTDGLSSSQPG